MTDKEEYMEKLNEIIKQLIVAKLMNWGDSNNDCR